MDVTLLTTEDNNTEGIGAYSRDLSKEYPDTVNVEFETFPAGQINPISHIGAVVRAFNKPSDIVHIQYEYALFGPISILSWIFFPAIYISSKITGKPAVITLHEVLNGDLIGERLNYLKSRYITLLNTLIIWSVDHVIFLSDTAEERFQSEITPSKFSTIPHGASTNPTFTFNKKKAKNKLGYDEEDILVVEPGYVVPRKGSHILIDIADHLNNYEFLLAGGAPEKHRGYYEEIVENAPENVQVSGILDDEMFHAAFQAADVVVLPYVNVDQKGVMNKVNQSGVFNQCAAYGVPVIASDQKYFRDLRKGYSCVKLFNQKDISDMTSCLEEVIHDASERDRLSKAIRTYAKDNSFQKVAESHQEVYEEAIQ